MYESNLLWVIIGRFQVNQMLPRGAPGIQAWRSPGQPRLKQEEEILAKKAAVAREIGTMGAPVIKDTLV